MKKGVFLGAALSCLICVLSSAASAQLINELDVNPNGNDGPCEYVELKGQPGAVIQNVHLVAFEGDTGTPNPGSADFVVSFGSPGPAFGANGILVITGTAACGARAYPADATRVQTALLDAAAGFLENGTISFMLIQSTTAITAGIDYDTNNDGTLEGLPAGAVILDAIGWSDGDAGDIVYTPAALTPLSGMIGAATRFPGNNNPSSSAAWYGGAMVGTNDATTYSPTARTANFPPNGALTPGAQNVGSTPRDAFLDLNGDGITDWAVARPSGGAGSQMTWYTQLNGASEYTGRDWGVVGDQVLSGDYDGDGHDDIAVFRPSDATFYIINSATQTLRYDQFGQTGDDARVVGDYDGDGRDDVAVYRAGAQSYWYYKTSQNAFYVEAPWGQTGDVPAPGDYDGDGRSDFVVRRDEEGSGQFYFQFANGNFSTSVFGLAADHIVPGDYDGDGKTDVAVVGSTGSASLQWKFVSSLTGNTVTDEWGAAAADLTVQGDYDGDGKTDYAVWRPDGGMFYIMTVGDRRIFSKQWGQAGDIPIAHFNTF